MAAARPTGSGSASSNVGSRQIYEADDQRTESRAQVQDRERYKEGQTHSHLGNDSSKFSPPPLLSNKLSLT